MRTAEKGYIYRDDVRTVVLTAYAFGLIPEAEQAVGGTTEEEGEGEVSTVSRSGLTDLYMNKFDTNQDSRMSFSEFQGLEATFQYEAVDVLVKNFRADGRITISNSISWVDK